MMALIERASSIQEQIDTTYAQAYKALQMQTSPSASVTNCPRHPFRWTTNLSVAFRQR